MANSDGEQFEAAVREFASGVASAFSGPVQTKPEDRLNDPVRDLLKACGDIFERRTESHQQPRAEGVGWPDIGVNVNRSLCGYIELKAPGRGARPEQFGGQDRKQWERYKALPNLIYTNGAEWSLYRSGERKARVRIADDIRESAGALERIRALERLLRDFLDWEPVAPSSARGVAEFLAPLSRYLRDEVLDALERGNERLHDLASEWGESAEDKQFADAFAQTLTYALLLARYEGAPNVRRAYAVDTLREKRYNLLATALDLLENARDELRVPFELLERAVAAVDTPSLVRDPQLPLLAPSPTDNDPWLHFYEDFLAAYDPALRKNSGVYFTPVPVVRAQVRFAAELLRDHFVKRDGFADPDVTVLDPACGTGTYPLAVIEHAIETVISTHGEGLVHEKISDLATRLHAFEILVGPYAVAHSRIAERLHRAGVTDQRPLVYLTDTLESPTLHSSLPDGAFYEPLTQERESAREVKRDKRILVCLGNPPYDREHLDAADTDRTRKGGWVRYGDEGSDDAPILDDFLKPVREAGGGVHLKNVYNDYVYFWRWALWKVFESTGEGGIVTFITASSYLSGPGFAGMRRRMREVFDDLWIIDLGGDNLGARKSDGVFAIRIPVAIAIGVRGGKANPNVPARVHKARLTGTAAEKLAALDAAATRADLRWRECVSDWSAPFFSAGAGAYFRWPKVTQVFPWQHSGGQLKRTWPIGETKTALEDRWQALLSTTSLEQRRRAFRETRDRTINREYEALLGGEPEPPIASLPHDAPPPPIAPYAYRSFDRQWVIAATRLADFGRPVLWRSHSDQQVYITSLLTKELGEGPGAIGASNVPEMNHFSGRGAKDTIPLYRDAAASEPNSTAGLLEQIGSELGAPPPRTPVRICVRHPRPARLCRTLLGRTRTAAAAPADHEGRGALRTRRRPRRAATSPPYLRRALQG